ncbi:aminoacetone oxidase family FAD-binding enzyme [Membranihabitans marinus]|uniref:aminoacetone oxidase family FAD-binding enzyme n=1 Tax=Membranihabitans marinus TaxID=1227546 RepID=UPI001F18AA2E|nr:aminoacetone oxidase family FAD-binding enzyme [Membranihabitans marinus]
MKIAILGGGAAGYFLAANLHNTDGKHEITIFEQTSKVLQKVRISGGGRCNVTHACWDPADLVEYYPRGKKELLGPFHHFACGDTMEWFESRGVSLKIEEDGRVFPVSDQSQSIIDCLQAEAAKNHVSLRLQHKWIDWTRDQNNGYVLHFDKKPDYHADIVVVTTGSQPKNWNILKGKDIDCVSPVPSLFTFRIDNKKLTSMAGISVQQGRVFLPSTDNSECEGPILITHWGLSGPAILKMSAHAAIDLAKLNYKFVVSISWLLLNTMDEFVEEMRLNHGKKRLKSIRPVEIPSRLWIYLLQRSKVDGEKVVSHLNKDEWTSLYQVLTADRYMVNGKTTYKSEFVTAGGMELSQLNFKNFKSKNYPGLYFSGEVLNIDAVTGGFNFQNAWTGSMLIANELNKIL